jgi:hypothetical protein
MPLNDNRTGEDRRDSEVTHITIMAKLEEMEQKLEPIFEVWEDVAAVGRIGKLVRRIVIWGAPICAALAAGYHFINNQPPSGP